VRSEVQEVRIGARSNIQDFVMLHIALAQPTIIGEDCLTTHHATLHGCPTGDRTMVGINATVIDGVDVGANSIVAGHAILIDGSQFPDHMVIAGVPVRVVAARDCSEANLSNAEFYRRSGANYANGVHRFESGERDTNALIARA
jgi:carbonic anhydrase/acetyltransferase-like protein (isoleucine patch superfamily)